MPESWQAVLRRDTALHALASLTDQPLHLVGGAVRDALRGATPITDWDILIPTDALAVARRFAAAIGGTYVPLHDAQPTARVVWGDQQFDIVEYRGDTLEADLRQRDLTINALAVDLRELHGGDRAAVIDPTSGRDDLAAGRLRPCGPVVFHADPLRALRLYRFAATLGFSPTSDAEAMANRVARSLPHVAPERITEELARLFAAPAAAPAIAGLARSGLWEAIVPEATAGRGMRQSANHHLDVFDHDLAASVAATGFLQTLDEWAAPDTDAFRAWLDTSLAGERSRRWIVPFAALLHDAGKPGVRTIEPDGEPGYPWHEQAGSHLAGRIADRLRLSRPERALLVHSIRQHGRPQDLPKRAPDDPLRLMAVLGADAPGTIMVSMGDRATARGPKRPPEKVAQDIAFLQGLLRDYFGTYAPLLATSPLVSGGDLIAALGLRPGRPIGRLLLQLRWRQLRGRLTDRADALRVAAELMRQSSAR